jgi:hypothetical protein
MRRLAFEVIGQSETKSAQSRKPRKKEEREKEENKLGLSCAKLRTCWG